MSHRSEYVVVQDKRRLADSNRCKASERNVSVNRLGRLLDFLLELLDPGSSEVSF